MDKSIEEKRLLEDWDSFSNEVHEHINFKGEKSYGYHPMEFYSDQFCIDTIIKYAMEIKFQREKEGSFSRTSKGTLYSIAHFAQIIDTRGDIQRGIETQKGGLPF